jgi:hypothetical protein
MQIVDFRPEEDQRYQRKEQENGGESRNGFDRVILRE